MSSNEFRAFADRLETARAEPGPVPATFERVAVLGSSPEAQLVACLCLAEGCDVALFSPYRRELDELTAAGSVTLRGDGPIGTFQFNRTPGPSIRLVGELDTAVDGADLIILTGPVLRQRAVAYPLGPLLVSGQTLVVMPGRTFGALEVSWMTRAGGRRVDLTVLEVQGFPFWIQASGSTLHLTRSGPVSVAPLPSGRLDAMHGLMRLVPGLSPAESVLMSSFSDSTSVVEIPALLIGGPAAPPGGVDIPPGGIPLPERQTFRALLGERHLALAAALAEERSRVASSWGVHDVPGLDEHLEIQAGRESGTGSRPVPGGPAADVLLRCAVVGSAIPLQSAASLAGLETPATAAVIDLAKAALGPEVGTVGRYLHSVGVTSGQMETARRALESTVRGTT